MTDTLTAAPVDNLFRGLAGVPVETRAEGDSGGTTLFGHFARFDEWNEIDSWYEGRFLERVAVGAYKKSMRERFDRIRIQFDHGYDTFVGSAPLGPPEVLREDDFGPYYEVPLLDTDYNRDRVLPMLAGTLMDGRNVGSVLGASYRFRVTKEEWVDPQKASDSNPDKLPERTIREVTLYELGPVVFGADEHATSGVRSVSLTDHFLARQAQRTGLVGRAARQFAQIAQIAGEAASGTSQATPIEPLRALAGPPTRSSAAVAAFLATAFD